MAVLHMLQGGEYVPVSNTNPLPIGSGYATAGTATLTNVASSATSVALLAANTARKGLIVENDSTAIAFLKFGATASATSFSVRLPANTRWEMSAPVYTGQIDAIWASANGAARVTQLT